MTVKMRVKAMGGDNMLNRRSMPFSVSCVIYYYLTLTRSSFISSSWLQSWPQKDALHCCAASCHYTKQVSRRRNEKEKEKRAVYAVCSASRVKLLTGQCRHHVLRACLVYSFLSPSNLPPFVPHAYLTFDVLHPLLFDQPQFILVSRLLTTTHPDQ